MKKLLLFLMIVSGACFCTSESSAQKADFRDTKLNIDERVAALISQLTLEEKIELLGFNHDGVERLGIHKYNWWNEGLHGVARAGEATVMTNWFTRLPM